MSRRIRFSRTTIDRKAGQGFVLIAGGIGIAPMRSILLTMRDRGDRRHVVLVYAVYDRTRLLFVRELEALRAVLNLDVVYVFEAPDAAWDGERGYITEELFRRHLPPHHLRYHYFVCGPVPMMNALETMLMTLGVPAGSVETERFNVV